ncbi:unnamed protein product [Paramecium octaurelia]|uniref:Uncharacterized protein n=1 Tax=Paramecium octaurelia TaxID=43137 RepID=A0A8S1UZN9_PAROT|nr:unnamed protein product [Paramecium octaurelia]
MIEAQIKDKFISTKPNIPDEAEFVIETPSIAIPEKLVQQTGQVGPARPSSEESYSSDEEVFEPDYEPIQKQVKVSENDGVRINRDSAEKNVQNFQDEDDDYIDPAALARDPALREAVEAQAAKRALLKYKPQNEELPSMEIQKERLASFPITHQLLIKGHTKQATAIGIDNAGSRLVTGAYDCVVRFWDFYGMDKNTHSFRLVTPYEGNQVNQISWAKDGKNVLIICADAQACVLDREGKRTMDTHRGDMYIRDILKTIGHTAAINSGCFHPDFSDVFVTCSDDGTVRIWDMTKKLYGVAQCLTHKDAVKCVDKTGHKVLVQCVTIRGRLLLCSCSDNTIKAYEVNQNCREIKKRPLFIIQDAHKGYVTKIKILADQKRFISQSVDNTIKLWETSNTNHHIYLQYCNINRFPPTRFDLNFNESILVTAHHTFKDGYHIAGPTELLFLNVNDLSINCRVQLFDQAITEVLWHPTLNQIFLGSDDGHVRALFNPKLSSKGALLATNRAVKFVHAENMELERHVLIPENLYIFKVSETVHGGMKIVEEKKSVKDQPRKPEPPQKGPGKGGKRSGPATLTQNLMSTLNDRPEKEDVVEELTKLDSITKANPQYVAQAYKYTQPQQIFDYSTNQQQEHTYLSSIKKICPHCGMKICACKRKVV